MKKIRQFNWLFFSFFFLSQEVFCDDLSRHTLDWTQLKIRFWGDAASSEEGDKGVDLQALEKKALDNGILYGKTIVQKLHRDYLVQEGVDLEVAEKSALQASIQVARSTYVYLTEYFADGSVRVYLENQLPRAYLRSDLNLGVEALSQEKNSEFSGLVLESENALSPIPYYRIEDENGETVFSLRNINKSGIERNLMGRWIVKPSQTELRRFVGANPLRLKIKQIKPGVLRTNRGHWNKIIAQSGSLLEFAKIALTSEDQSL